MCVRINAFETPRDEVCILFFLKSSTLQPLKLETSNFSVSAKTSQTSVKVKGVLCSGRRRCTDVPFLGCWFRGAEPAQQQQRSPRSPRSLACRKASGTSRTRLVFCGDSNLEFGVKLEVSTFCFPLLGLLPDLHYCLGQDIEVATGFWQDTLYQLVRWCMALPYWPLLLQDFWLVPSGHQRQRCATMVDSNLWLVTGRGIHLRS